FGDERVHAADDVPHVADAEVADIKRAESRTVTCAPAIVGLENERAAGQPGLNGIVRVAGRKGWVRNASGSAVNNDEQRIFFRGVVVSGLAQDAFDGAAVLRLPGDDFGGADGPVGDLSRKIGELARGEVV